MPTVVESAVLIVGSPIVDTSSSPPVDLLAKVSDQFLDAVMVMVPGALLPFRFVAFDAALSQLLGETLPVELVEESRIAYLPVLFALAVPVRLFYVLHEVAVYPGEVSLVSGQGGWRSRGHIDWMPTVGIFGPLERVPSASTAQVVEALHGDFGVCLSGSV